MKKFTFSLALLAVLGLGLMPSVANAGKIGAYFDAVGTVRSADVGVGLVTLYIYGDGYPGFISGAQYKVDYGPHLTHIADAGLPPVYVGASDDGISVGFGFSPRSGAKFLIHLALCEWVGDCSVQNVDGPTVIAHPGFPEPTAIVARFPDQAIFPAPDTRSLTCPMVELKFPGKCPHHFRAHSWKYLFQGQLTKGGKLKAAILASVSLNIADINASTVRLQGVAPLSWSMQDVGMPDGDNDCDCDDVSGGGGGKDGGSGKTSGGDPDLLFEFSNPEIAGAIGALPPAEGTEVELTMTGEYNDGLPFEAKGCVVIKGRLKGKDLPGDQGSGKGGGGFATAGLGYPSPNPFNPVTRISYNVPSAQHVHIAIYDVAGRLVENLVNEVKAGGEYVVEWDAGRLPSGVYFYRMQTGEKTIVRRATLLK
jgi:hypothetical protein